MSFDPKAPVPLKTGVELGVTTLTGFVQPAGRVFIMSDDHRDELYMTALAADRTGRFTRPMGKEEDRRPCGGDAWADGWNRRERAAAAKLGALWKAAAPGIAIPGGYPGGGKGGGTMSEEEEMAAHLAFKEYSAAMDQVRIRCGDRHAEALRMVVIYCEAMPQERRWRVREALAFLADWWRLK